MLRPLGPTPFLRVRELQRRVHPDHMVEVDTNHYSVPWNLIGKRVLVRVFDGQILVLCDGGFVATHEAVSPSRARVIDSQHLDGLVRRQDAWAPATSSLARPLDVYEAAVGGAL